VKCDLHLLAELSLMLTVINASFSCDLLRQIITSCESTVCFEKALSPQSL